MLLSAIEAKRFLPVGTDREVESDSRDLNAATVRMATLAARSSMSRVSREPRRMTPIG